jgi:GTPase
MPRPVVAIVGRPNVGKSTLFNRLIGERVAIVEDVPGITRDRVYGHTDWNGREFTVIDTGGLGMESEDPFGRDIQLQAEIAIEEADLIVLLVDARQGMTAGDEEVAAFFRRAGKPIVLVVNKADNPRLESTAPEFYRLGLGDPHTVSAHSGRGVGDLLDEVVRALPPPEEEAEEEDERIRIAIVGRPNVGKSSLLNAILGEDRVIVSPVAGTTREAIDVPFDFEDQEYMLIDTAGIRRAGKVQGVEFYSVLRSERAIERADVAVLVVDAPAGLVDGDKRVGGLANEAGRATVIFVNKWDAISGLAPRGFLQTVRTEMPFIGYAPIVVGSAEQGKGLDDLLRECADVANNHALRIPTPELNRVIHEAVDRRPYTRRGREFKIYYASQVAVKPPAFAFFVNDPQIPHQSYLRYLENQLRAAFGFTGTPIRIFLRQRSREASRSEAGRG